MVWKWRCDESFKAVETLALLSGTCRLRVSVWFLHWNYWQYCANYLHSCFIYKIWLKIVAAIVWGLSKYHIPSIWYIISHLFDTHDITLLFHYFDIVNIITNIFQRFFSQLVSVIWFFYTKPSKQSHRTTILGRLLRNYPASWRNRIETCMGNPCQWPVTRCSQVDIFSIFPGAREFSWHRQSHHRSHL